MKIELCSQILTKDSVTVFVNAIMYYKVKDAISAVINVDDYSGSARLLAATTLRNVLGTKNLGDILSDRESIASDMQVQLCCQGSSYICSISLSACQPPLSATPVGHHLSANHRRPRPSVTDPSATAHRL